MLHNLSEQELMSTKSDLEKFNIQAWLKQGALFSTTTQHLMLGWGKASWHSQPASTTTCFYLPDFFLKDPSPWLHFEYSATLTIEELIALLLSLDVEPLPPIRWQEPSKPLFTQGFDELQRLFHAHTLDKAVLYAFSNSTDKFTKMHLKHSLLSLLEYIQVAPTFIYGFWESSQGMLGATPELLFRVHSARPLELQTMALAGTQKTDALSQQMLQDLKLQHEHQLVVEDIISRLAPFGKTNTGQLQVLTLPLLSHLYTPISVSLTKDEDFSSFIAALHPTPALGGFPRAAATTLLKDYNHLLPRGRFGAPAGLLDTRSKQMLCYVAIRNVMWEAHSVKVGAGCGIVAESLLEKEWEEILLKTESIMRFLNL